MLPPAVAQLVTTFMGMTDALAAVSRDRELDGPQAALVAKVLAAGVSRLAAASVGLLPVIEADGRWAVGGAKSFAKWVADRQDLGSRPRGRR